MTAGPPPREAWQAASTGHSTKPQRIATAIVLLLLAAIAVVVFFNTMGGPSKITPFVQSMYVRDYDRLIAHSPYVQQDIGRLRDLFVQPGNTGGNNRSYNEYAITSGAPLTNQELQSERLGNFEACQSKDIAIFYIAANGVVDDEGRPGLLSSDGKINRLDELLSQIQAISASTKLVFIDAGQISEDYLNGIPVNQFPFALHQLMAAKVGDVNTYDENLWVINSHGLFQSSILSHTRRGSVFGVSVFDALADFRVNGDQNEPIKLGQLYQAICNRCAAMTMDGDRPAQMPLLMRGGHGIVVFSDQEVRNQAMAQDIIFARQMTPAPSADPVADETPPAPEVGEKIDAAAVADKTGDKEDAAEPAQGNEETAIERIWNLRDQLQNRQLGSGYSPIDFAPQIWLRINDQIVQFDQQQRNGSVPVDRKLDATENDLRILASLMKANEASSDTGYRSNSLEVSARLVAEWNQFVTSNRAGTSMNKEIAECRDIYFRSRYFLEWTRIPAFRNSMELQEEFLALMAELRQIRPLIINSSIQSTDLPSIGASVAKLRIREKQMLGLVVSMVTELNKSGTNRSARDVYRDEQAINSLLDSPLLGYSGPFGFMNPGSENDPPHILSRKSLNDSFANLRAQNLQPLPVEDSPFQWATDLWIAPGQKVVNDSQDKMKIAKAFLALAGDSTGFAARSDCQLPDRSRVPNEQWESGVANCLTTLRDSGLEITKAQAEFSRMIEIENSGSLQAWPLAILLDQRTIHTIAQPRDALFVALPPRIEEIAEPIVVNFGSVDSVKIDLDQPKTKQKIFFSTKGGDPKNIELKLSINDSDKEYANLLEFVGEGIGVIEPDKPFFFPLARDDTNGRLLPFELTIRSSPTNARQAGQDIGITLFLVGSDDERVRIDPAEIFPFAVLLPKEDRVDLVVGKSSFSTHTVSATTSVDSYRYYDREASLFAFPNRFREFDFQLENKSGRTKSFKFELFSVVRPDSFDTTNVLPGQVVNKTLNEPVALARQLESLKRATLGKAPLATSKELELAPGGKDLLDFRPKPVEPAATSDTPGNGPASQVAAETETQFDLNNGIYCRLSETDVDHGRQTTRDFWFDIKPLPSEELVSATAEFNPDSKLFTVTIKPSLRWNNGTPCPVPGGIKCLLQTGNSGDFTNNIVSVSDTLSDEKTRIELQFHISQEELASRGPVLLYVNINEYRGVFIYELAESDFTGLTRTKENLRKDNNFLILRRITTLSEGKEPVSHLKKGDQWSFTPPERMVFEVLADIDDGSSDNCKIQFDFKRQEWPTARTQLRTSDRQIDFRAKVNEKNGFLDLQALVKDHSFEEPLAEIDASGAYVLRGRVVFPDNRANRVRGEESFPESLLIDGKPPVVNEMRWVIDGVNQREFASIKETQQQVQLELVTTDLTGTKSVRLFVDKDNDPVVSDADKDLGTAIPNGVSENWRFPFDIEKMLKDETLSIGVNNIYVLLVDQLDNPTDQSKPFGPLTLTIRKLTAQERAMFEESKIKKYTLNVKLSRRDSTPVPKPLPPEIRAKILGSDGKEIQFRSSGNQDGSYSVFDVPVGEYTLVCEYIHTTPTYVKKKMRIEQPLQLSVQNEPDPIVLILEEVEEDD